MSNDYDSDYDLLVIRLRFIHTLYVISLISWSNYYLIFKGE